MPFWFIYFFNHFLIVSISFCKAFESDDDQEIPLPLKSCEFIEQLVYDRYMYITNCTNTNFTDVNLLRFVPNKTQILIFKGNSFPELPVNVFGKRRNQHDALEVIDLSNNQIEHVHGKSFHDVNFVKKLILSNNNILITGNEFHSRLLSNFQNLEELYLDNAFGDEERGFNFVEDLMTMLTEAKLSKLRILHLENNQIGQFPHEMVFCSLPNIQRLYLSNNYLSEIRINFTCTSRIRTLDLSFNHIKNLDNISSFYLDHVTRGFHVNLTGNPFRCDCHMSHFLNWFKRTPLFVINRESYHCHSGYPETNAQKLLTNLTLADLQCDTYIHSNFKTYLTASYSILIALIIFLCLLLTGLIYSSREHLSSTWSQFSSRLSSKRQYTSLEKDEIRRENVNEEVDEVAV